VQHTGYLVGDLAIYECEKQHFLIGSVIRECLNNKRWSGVETICAGKGSYDKILISYYYYLIQNKKFLSPNGWKSQK